MRVVGSAAMSEAVAERPSWRISFRWLIAVALGLALIAFLAGSRIYRHYGGYRPMALMHVPQTMRYRARVDLGDTARAPQLRPLFVAMDPRGLRRKALEQRLGTSLESVVHEVAFGVGPAPTDFVVVLGLQLQAETGLPPAKSVCEALALDGIHSQPTETGCRLGDGAIVAQALDDMVVVASHPDLVKDLLGRPDIGDRLGFSGPSVRGVAPEIPELGREAQQLAQLFGAKYP
jgi:hypothetical protein